jgi:SAM-dependent methyltransferase
MNAMVSAPAAAFDGIAEKYDEVFTNSLIGRAQRDVVWHELGRLFPLGTRVLELNCGTGEDALFLAGRGVEVTALDQSPAMIDVAMRRLTSKPRARVAFRLLDNEELDRLQPCQPFDGSFSNFAGLNCVRDLQHVAENLAQLLKPGAPLVLCMLGPCCLWEMVWYSLSGRWKKAFRRLANAPVTARIGNGPPLEVRYHSARALEKMFQPYFKLQSWQGIGITVPPSYVEPLAKRFPRMLRVFAWLDSYLCRCPGVRGTADHILLLFERV